MMMKGNAGREEWPAFLELMDFERILLDVPRQYDDDQLS